MTRLIHYFKKQTFSKSNLKVSFYKSSYKNKNLDLDFLLNIEKKKCWMNSAKATEVISLLFFSLPKHSIKKRIFNRATNKLGWLQYLIGAEMKYASQYCGSGVLTAAHDPIILSRRTRTIEMM